MSIPANTLIVLKIDLNVLVKNTTTGISNAREYQMLWRHLAYHKAFLEKIEDGAEPLVSLLFCSCIQFIVEIVSLALLTRSTLG